MLERTRQWVLGLWRDGAHTKVVLEEHEGGYVRPEREELGYEHEPVPRTDGQGHHQQLSEYDRGEGDGRDVHKVLFKQQQGSVHDNTTCKRRRAGCDTVSWANDRSTLVNHGVHIEDNGVLNS